VWGTVPVQRCIGRGRKSEFDYSGREKKAYISPRGHKPKDGGKKEGESRLSGCSRFLKQKKIFIYANYEKVAEASFVQMKKRRRNDPR